MAPRTTPAALPPYYSSPPSSSNEIQELNGAGAPHTVPTVVADYPFVLAPPVSKLFKSTT
eukprot:1196101-Prorocentrum_minimum.AAC.6